MIDTRNRILLSLHLVSKEDDEELNEKDRAYFNAYLLANGGISLVNPEKLTEGVFRKLEPLFPLSVPPSFYKNPQDTTLFSKDELLLEQLVSYFLGYGTGLGRVELFKKAAPSYLSSKDIKEREYRIIEKEEAERILKEHMLSLCAYKRPFSVDEAEDFACLFERGYYEKDTQICCKDNIFYLLPYDDSFVSCLDKKDLVKFSISVFDEHKFHLNRIILKNKEIANVFKTAIPLVKDCPLSKKQAKYFNMLCNNLGIKHKKETHKNSPEARAIAAIRKGEIIKAAEISASAGSSLSRHLTFLLSRANEEETKRILDMIPNDNPTVLLQLLNGLYLEKENFPRTFRFYKKNTLKMHTENGIETKNRKSVLSKETIEKVSTILRKKIFESYSKAPKIGKIYVSEQFKNIAIPLNTSASSSGIDILPSGSRIPFKADFIRTFVYWNDVFDIDSSAIIIREPKEAKDYELTLNDVLSWRTYFSKPFNKFALSSGDCTDITGSEYQDYDIEGLLSLDYRYVIYCLNGYAGKFGDNDIHTGIQIKNDLKTKAWDPKNIEFQMDVRGECRSMASFAIDLKKREIIVLNIKTNGGAVVSKNELNAASIYLDERFLSVNMYDVLSLKGEKVENKEDADIVFDAEYQPKEGQTVVRPYDISKLIELSK